MSNYKGKSKGKKSNPKFKDEQRTNNNRERSNTRTKTAESGYTRDSFEAGMRGHNDISWYTKNPKLVEAAARFPFPYRPGMDIKLTDNASPIKVSTNIPGVAALTWIPSVGRSTTNTSPISMVAKEIYAKVRSAFSGSLAADAPDYVTYLMALDSIYSYISWLRRVYGILNTFTGENYIKPDTLLHAMNFSDQEIQSLRANKAQFWQYINQLALQVNKFTCPDIMDVFKRHWWMSENIYTDSLDASSCQFYLFNLGGVFKYADRVSGDIPGLIMVKLPTLDWNNSTRNVTALSLYEFGVQLIEALVAWDDSYTIDGYLKRAFEGSNFFAVDQIDINFTVVPVWNPEVNMQIENSRTIPGGLQWVLGTVNNTNFSIWQDPFTNSVLHNPRTYTNSTVDYDLSLNAQAKVKFNHLLNIRCNGVPAPEMTVIATRLHADAEVSYSSESSTYQIDIKPATEIPLVWRLYDITTPYNFIGDDGVINTFTAFNFGAANDQIALRRFFKLTHYEHHPIMFVFGSQTLPSEWDESTDFWCEMVGDMAKMTTISDDDLANLHQVCLLSEFNAFGVQ